MANTVIPPGTIPSASALQQQILSDINGVIGQNVPGLSKAFFYVLATCLGGLQHLCYRFGAWILNQIFPQTADMPQLILIGGRLNPPVIPNGAVAWQGTATVPGTSGTSIPAGTLWAVNGLLYNQTATVVIGGGPATISLTCLTSSFASGLNNGVVLQPTSPIAGVTGGATIASTTVAGADPELPAAFRLRVIAAMSTPPQGGAVPDYVNMAKASGQRVAWAQAFLLAPGFVGVYILPAPGNATVLPGSPMIAAVQTYMSSTLRRNLNANVIVYAPTVLSLNLAITGTGMTAAQQAQATADITAYLLAAFPAQYPGAPNNTNVISMAAIYGILAADGATGGTVVLTIPGQMLTNNQYTLTPGQLIALGTISSWS
jgi:uncharacterized phage protein gp47/JayE